MNVNNILGTFCTMHPNICLYANGKLNRDDSTAFIVTEFPEICKTWSQTKTEQSSMHFSDAYWISKCIIKDEKSEAFENMSLMLKYAHCHTLIAEIPITISSGSRRGPFWSKIATRIDNLKNRISNEYINHTTTLSSIIDRHCSYVVEHPSIIQIAKYGIDEHLSQDAFEKVSTELMETVEKWANTNYRNSPLEQYMLIHMNKTENTRLLALDDICNSYWLMRAWVFAIDYVLKNNDAVDSNILEIAERVSVMCDAISSIDTELCNTISIMVFSETRAVIRKKLRVQFSIANENSGRY